MTLPEPVFADGLVTLYNGDCLDLLPELEADALVTDPPYGTGLKVKQVRNDRRSGSHPVGRASVLYDDEPDRVAELIRAAIPLALSRVKRGLVFPGYSMLWEYPRPKVVSAVWMVNGMGYTPWGFGMSQPILYYGACPYLEKQLGNRPNGFVGTNHKTDNTLDHPCPKPLEWMRWAVNRATLEGETVLDPFAGTGTTLIAARMLGRRAIGIELEPHYCKIAAERLAQGVLPLDLEPAPEPPPELVLDLELDPSGVL